VRLCVWVWGGSKKGLGRVMEEGERVGGGLNGETKRKERQGYVIMGEHGIGVKRFPLAFFPFLFFFVSGVFLLHTLRCGEGRKKKNTETGRQRDSHLQNKPTHKSV
jgi:hypothetical protein